MTCSIHARASVFLASSQRLERSEEWQADWGLIGRFIFFSGPNNSSGSSRLFSPALLVWLGMPLENEKRYWEQTREETSHREKFQPGIRMESSGLYTTRDIFRYSELLF